MQLNVVYLLQLLVTNNKKSVAGLVWQNIYCHGLINTENSTPPDLNHRLSRRWIKPDLTRHWMPAFSTFCYQKVLNFDIQHYIQHRSWKGIIIIIYAFFFALLVIRCSLFCWISTLRHYIWLMVALCWHEDSMMKRTKSVTPHITTWKSTVQESILILKLYISTPGNQC